MRIYVKITLLDTKCKIVGQLFTFSYSKYSLTYSHFCLLRKVNYKY